MRFIAIDGLDGSGKDTQARLLGEHLSKNDNYVIIRAHPAQDNPLGRISKKALMRKGQLMRMVATLFYGFDVIRSILLYCKKDNTVIFVRYIMASAYLPRPLIRPVYAIVSRLLPTSDEMFFIDVAPEEALRRVRARGEAEEMFETLPHMEKVRNRAMLITRDWKVIDGNRTPDEVFARILEKLRQ